MVPATLLLFFASQAGVTPPPSRVARKILAAVAPPARGVDPDETVAEDA